MSSKVMPLVARLKRKRAIPKAVREQLWLRDMGKEFEGKCKTTWCKNTITIFDFQCGHNVPESKGGPTVLDNLVAICSRCNLSMGNQYTFDEWCKTYGTQKTFFQRLACCFTGQVPPSTEVKNS